MVSFSKAKLRLRSLRAKIRLTDSGCGSYLIDIALARFVFARGRIPFLGAQCVLSTNSLFGSFTPEKGFLLGELAKKTLIQWLSSQNLYGFQEACEVALDRKVRKAIEDYESRTESD